MISYWNFWDTGAKVGGRKINCVRFADNMVILVESVHKLNGMPKAEGGSIINKKAIKGNEDVLNGGRKKNKRSWISVMEEGYQNPRMILEIREKRKLLNTTPKRRSNWIGHVLRKMLEGSLEEEKEWQLSAG
ncbi:hypothetical protein PPYR_13966 [Photinus pyralis]|uniref:Reverse transcriptase domain-containing protein n=1 Tax=Photinus pyralis TaxID=7054 RepID=A0A5N4A3U9_PHOPY|nr:hypothetical protein PPYR_13966 [Photinus pyralis]